MKNLYTHGGRKTKIEIDAEPWIGIGILYNADDTTWGIQFAMPFLVFTFKFTKSKKS